MFSRKADGPLVVEVPTPTEDRPSWGKVAVIAAIGFIVGVAWPRLAGVRLGPAVPESPATSIASGPTADSALPSVASAGAPAASAVRAASASVPAVASAPAPSAVLSAPLAPASAAPPEHVATVASVTHGSVLACTTAAGEALKGNDCGTLAALDGVLLPRLRKMADCPDAAGTSGRLHLVAHVDFPRNALGIDFG